MVFIFRKIKASSFTSSGPKPELEGHWINPIMAPASNKKTLTAKTDPGARGLTVSKFQQLW